MSSRCIKFFIKKNPAPRDSPPAAGRFSDTILFCRSAILTERSLLYRNFLYNKRPYSFPIAGKNPFSLKIRKVFELMLPISGNFLFIHAFLE